MKKRKQADEYDALHIRSRYRDPRPAMRRYMKRRVNRIFRQEQKHDIEERMQDMSEEITDYGVAEEAAYRQARDDGQDWCVIAGDTEGTYLVVTQDEALRFAEDQDRYRIVYTARPYAGGIAGVYGDKAEIAEVYSGREEYGEE